MSGMCFAALRAGKKLAGNATHKVLTVYVRSISGSKKLTFRNIDRFANFNSTWIKPKYTFYSQDSNGKKPVIPQLIPEQKTKKYEPTEKPLELTAEQIRALFYKRMEEPIALISQDKYYTYLKPSSKYGIQDNDIPETMTTLLEATNYPNKNITKNTSTVSMKPELFVNIQNPYEFPNQEKNTPNVINTILEKELGESTNFEDNTNEDQTTRKSWNTIKYAFFTIGTSIIVILVGSIIYIGGPKIDEDQVGADLYSDRPILLQYIYRSLDEFHNFNKLIKDPSRDKLLPDVLKPPYYQPPYTLVLEFTDILVHPEWTYTTGWRFKKRPGLDQFLEALYARYEVVVYTAEMGMTVFPIIEALDKNNLISYKLVRDATKFMDGHHVKDLDKLNRDLSKVIVIDWNPESTKLHKDNLFRIPRWKGNDDDTSLFDLTALLIAISEWKVEDVRSVLKYYSGFEDPLASFKERQKLLAAQDL